MGCVLQGTFLKHFCIVPRTGAPVDTLYGMPKVETSTQAPLGLIQLTPPLLHLSNINQNEPSDCLRKWDLLWEMGLLEAPCY